MNAILLLSGLGLVTLFTGVYNLRKLILPLVILGLIGALVVNLWDWNTSKHFYNGSDMLVFDNYAIAFSALLMVLSIFIFFLCDQHFIDSDSNVADIFALIIFTLIGGVMMASYNNLTMLFLGIETLSISLYILAGSKKLDLASNEAALKYFLLGSFSTGFLLFGIALIFGAANSFHLVAIRDYVIHNADHLPVMFIVGVLLLLTGLLFKVSAVPFHFWAPDVYVGSPTLITTFMATVAKTAAFAAIFRIFYVCFGSIPHVWFYALYTVTVLTIVVGNFSALRQASVKRMLAYSSLANAGYLLISVVALNDHAPSALLYYTAAYSLATIAAFGVLMAVAEKRGSDDYEAFHGLAKSNPLLTVVMVISMLSLAGIPPLSGFFAKYYIFSNAIEDGWVWLVVIAILNSLLGIYYYFKVIVAMFTTGAEGQDRIPVRGSYGFILTLAALAILVLGLFPGLIVGLLG